MSNICESPNNSSCPTNISYNVNLGFDMQTTNHNSLLHIPSDLNDQNVSRFQDDLSNSKQSNAVCDNLSGKSNNNCHSENPSLRNGYFRSTGSGHGKPNSNSHDLNSVAELQNDSSCNN